MPDTDLKARKIELSPDFTRIAVLFERGILWLGTLEENQVSRIIQITIDMNLMEIAWCGNKDALLGFDIENSQLLILTPEGDFVQEYLPGFICAVPEIDSARVYTVHTQELIRKLPKALVNIFR